MLLTTRHSEPIVVSEGSQPLLSRRELLGISVLWFGLNFQFAALLPIVVPAQILLLVTPGSAGHARASSRSSAPWRHWGQSPQSSCSRSLGLPLIAPASRLGRRRPYIIAGGA